MSILPILCHPKVRWSDIDEAELGLEKRIVAPASAPSPVVLGKRVYNFQGCYGGGAFGE